MKKELKKYILIIVLIIILVFIDQIIKIIVEQKNGGQDISLINNKVQIIYTTNGGFAFNIGNSKIAVIITDIIVIIALIRFIITQIDRMHKITKISISLILAGGIGNLIDRLFRGHVIDYINIRNIIHNFPVFNLADTLIIVGFIIFAAITAFDTFGIIKEKKHTIKFK